MEIRTADGRNQEIDDGGIRQALLGAMLSKMAAKLEGVVQELQASARLGNKAQDEGQEGGKLQRLDVFGCRALGFVDGRCDGVCKTGYSKLSGLQVVGVVLEHLDDSGGVEGDLLANVGATMVGNGGQRS